jgi:hypothetical protein
MAIPATGPSTTIEFGVKPFINAVVCRVTIIRYMPIRRWRGGSKPLIAG